MPAQAQCDVQQPALYSQEYQAVVFCLLATPCFLQRNNGQGVNRKDVTMEWTRSGEEKPQRFVVCLL